MSITLYNTKTRQKEKFTPLDPKNIRMYICGPTVYDRAHIGNARSVIVFDILFRLLKEVYGSRHVHYARNFTDIDDKINAQSKKTGRSIYEITNETIKWYQDDMAALGALPPTYMPRATEYIQHIIAMISELITKNHAYIDGGHVLFSVKSYHAYGQLSRQSISDIIAGARIKVASYKADPMDFILWKPSSDDEPGWNSPWGYGRPGWHIECSAMSRHLFGKRFDIHGGGLDLMFPHHENEIAQSCACDGEDNFAQIWLHHEMLQVEGKKMSKSLGNFFSVRDLLNQGYPGEVIRMVYLGTHYSKPMDWTEQKAAEAKTTLQRWRKLTKDVSDDDMAVSDRVLNAVCDDLNTPAALTALHHLAKEGDVAKLKSSAKLLGILTSDMGDWESSCSVTNDISTRIESLITARNHARNNREFTRADALRNILEQAGVILSDTTEGTTWELSSSFDATKLEDT